MQCFWCQAINSWYNAGYSAYSSLQYTNIVSNNCNCNCLVQPPVHRFTVGSRAFSVAGPQVWNCLPQEVTSAPPLATFRTRHQTSVYWVILWHSTYVTFTLHTVYSAPIVVFLILRLFDWLIDWLIMFPFTDPGIFERPRVVPPLPFLSPSPLPYSFTSPFALRSRTP